MYYWCIRWRICVCRSLYIIFGCVYASWKLFCARLQITLQSGQLRIFVTLVIGILCVLSKSSFINFTFHQILYFCSGCLGIFMKKKTFLDVTFDKNCRCSSTPNYYTQFCELILLNIRLFVFITILKCLVLTSSVRLEQRWSWMFHIIYINYISISNVFYMMTAVNSVQGSHFVLSQASYLEMLSQFQAILSSRMIEICCSCFWWSFRNSANSNINTGNVFVQNGSRHESNCLRPLPFGNWEL